MQTLAERENKLFIGMLPKTMAEAHLQEMFGRFGEIREVLIQLCCGLGAEIPLTHDRYILFVALKDSLKDVRS
jgi:hypothetical protein